MKADILMVPDAPKDKTVLEVTDDATVLRTIITEMMVSLRKGRKSRERSMAITKLEEARMWLVQDLANE
jgi:hypothetical protein